MVLKASQIVSELVNDDIDEIIHAYYNNDIDAIGAILADGWRGYNKMPTMALLQTYVARFSIEGEIEVLEDREVVPAEEEV